MAQLTEATDVATDILVLCRHVSLRFSKRRPNPERSRKLWRSRLRRPAIRACCCSSCCRDTDLAPGFRSPEWYLLGGWWGGPKPGMGLSKSNRRVTEGFPVPLRCPFVCLNGGFVRGYLFLSIETPSADARVAVNAVVNTTPIGAAAVDPPGPWQAPGGGVDFLGKNFRSALFT